MKPPPSVRPCWSSPPEEAAMPKSVFGAPPRINSPLPWRTRAGTAKAAWRDNSSPAKRPRHTARPRWAADFSHDGLPLGQPFLLISRPWQIRASFLVRCREFSAALSTKPVAANRRFRHFVVHFVAHFVEADRISIQYATRRTEVEVLGQALANGNESLIFRAAWQPPTCLRRN